VSGLSTKLKVDGKEVEINEFVEKFLAGTIVGAVSTLNGIEADWKKIEIVIKK
jgi:hypothetical protein